jgi:hypothetical protein
VINYSVGISLSDACGEWSCEFIPLNRITRLQSFLINLLQLPILLTRFIRVLFLLVPVSRHELITHYTNYTWKKADRYVFRSYADSENRKRETETCITFAWNMQARFPQLYIQIIRLNPKNPQELSMACCSCQYNCTEAALLGPP